MTMIPELVSGSEADYRQLKWAELYERRLSNLPNSTILVPMGDSQVGKLNASSFTSLGKHTDGLASAAWTPTGGAGGLSGLDDGVTYEGPGGIPVIKVNGTDEYLTSPTDAKWSTAGAMSVGVWLKPDAIAGGEVIFSRWNFTDSLEEWVLDLGTTGPRFALWDVPNEARIRRNVTSGDLVVGQWGHIIATFDGGTTASGIKVYVNGVQTDDEDGNSGSGFADVAAASQPTLIGVQNLPSLSGHYDGSMAGGPLGPFFCKTELTAAQVLNDFRLTAPALGVLA